jgi:hypothetical protein
MKEIDHRPIHLYPPPEIIEILKKNNQPLPEPPFSSVFDSLFDDWDNPLIGNVKFIYYFAWENIK